MKKLLIALMILFSIGLQAQDVTGTWVCAGAYKAELFQEGQNVYGIYNVSNFKHYLSGRFISANQLEAQVVRINLDNNCRTTMTFRYTLNGNTLTGSWTANDSNCDLGIGQSAPETMTRTTPSARPMNPFSGSAFNPTNDVTGSWSWGEGNLDGDWMQDNQNVYLILNGSGYKQYFRGTRSGNQITGQLIRYNPSGCRMILNQTYTQTNANTMQYSWVGVGDCDVRNGQTGSGTITRRGGGGVSPPVNPNCVIVYEQPNYQGRSASFCNAGAQEAPFAVKSMRIPNGFSVHSNNVGECFGVIFTADFNGFGLCDNANRFTILTTPSSRQVEVTLLQVNSTIHNGDCQKFYGTVSAFVSFNSGGNLGFAHLINWARGPVRNIPNYSASDIRNIENARFVVRVDENMLNQCTFSVNTNLGSAHKSCDLCSGFTWENKMPQPQTFEINLATALSQGTFVVGPYRTTRSSNDNHDIRVKFQVRRL